MNTTDLMQRINQRIDNMTDKACKEDMRLLITSLVTFTNEQDDRILDPQTDAEDLPKLFFKLVINLGTEAGIAQLRKKSREDFEKKIKNLMVLWPMLQRYSNTYDGNEDVTFMEIKNELPAPENE